MGADFSEYSFMHIPHYLTETLRKAERNNGVLWQQRQEGKSSLKSIFLISTRQSFIQQRQQEIKQ